MSVADMQNGIQIEDNEISGTLKYVASGWDEDTWPENKDAGNYLAVMIVAENGATTTAELIGGAAGDVVLSGNKAVFRITATTQKIKIASSIGTRTLRNIYTLNDLTLTPAPAPEAEPGPEA